jgi:hypothetical protein
LRPTVDNECGSSSNPKRSSIKRCSRSGSVRTALTRARRRPDDSVSAVAWPLLCDGWFVITAGRNLDVDQVSAGLSAAQVLPALAGAILGLPAGIALAEALDDDPVTIPPLCQLLAVVLGSALLIAALTAIAGRIGTRRRVGEILQAELP